MCVAVMSAGAANIAASSADINSSSSSNSNASVVRPSWVAAGCGLVLDPVLAMKLVAVHDGLRNVAAVPLSSAISASPDVFTSFVPATSSAVTATVAAVTMST